MGWIEVSSYDPNYFGVDVSAKKWEEALYVLGWVVSIVSCLLPVFLFFMLGIGEERTMVKISFAGVVLGIAISGLAKVFYLCRIGRSR